MQVKEPETMEVQTVRLGQDAEPTGNAAAAPVRAEQPGAAQVEADDVLADALGTLSSAHGKTAASPRRGIERAAGPMTANRYTYWNLYAAGPYNTPYGDQINAPNLRPSKIVSVGERVRFYVNLWANPAFDDSGVNNGPAQLAGHDLQVCLQINNLTTWSIEHSECGTVGKNGTLIGYGVNQWPENSLVRFDFIAPSVGPRPELMEAIFTVDMVGTALPYAGYVTHVWDPDRDSAIPVPYIDVSEPGNPVLLGNIAAANPGWRFEIPMRFLVANPSN